MKGLSQNPDVIVVGAGVAGLSAAAALRHAGLDTIVLEAGAQIGGRCITDQTTFSVPFDRGGSWLHSAPINPLAQIAERSDVPLHKSPWICSKVETMGHKLSSDELAKYREYEAEMWSIIRNLDVRNQDVAIEAILPTGRWKAAAKHSIAQMLAADADVASAQDAFNYAHADGDWLVEGGLGAFMGRIHKDVPVRCGCPVTKIDHSGSLVKVTTPHGMIQAPQVIITVSTGVLAKETIEFVPGLPASKRDAIDMLPNGLLNKVGIEFDPAWAEAVQGQMAEYHSGDDEFCSLLFGFFGTGLATGFVAGRFADQLEQDGAGAATAYCVDALRALFGSKVEAAILKTSETAWRANAHTVGAYSLAKPGGSGCRQTLSEPIGDRLFFAGEATMTNTYSTVHGAYLSGQKAATEIQALRANTCAQMRAGIT